MRPATLDVLPALLSAFPRGTAPNGTTVTPGSQVAVCYVFRFERTATGDNVDAFIQNLLDERCFIAESR